MPNYTKVTNFTVKDSLAPGTPAKRVLGSEIDLELNAVATAIASKAESTSITVSTSAPSGGVDGDTWLRY